MRIGINKETACGLILVMTTFGLGGCDQKTAPEQEAAQHTKKAVIPGVLSPIDPKDKLKGLTIQMVKPELAVPFCEHDECLHIDIQSLTTTDAWLDQWIEQRIAAAILDLLDVKQALSLQQAVNRFVEASDQWKQKDQQHQSYQLQISTRIAMQRGEYVLLQVLLDAKVDEKQIKQRSYFFNCQRQQQQQLKLLDVIAPQQQQQMHALIQSEYQAWLKTLAPDVVKKAPKTLYWGQADWFFDEEGIGLHYRAEQIAEALPQFSIYLNREQTQKMLKPDVFQHLFQPL